MALACSSCVRVSWSRVEVGRSLPEGLHAAFTPSGTDLAQCLERLGAPLYVWELSAEEYGLAYGWDYHRGWGLNLSIPLTQEFSASVDYEDLDQKLRGVVLIFDRHDRLLRKRTGFLADTLGGGGRRRPEVVPAAESVEGDPE
jgi:hypothetical protein